MFGTYFNGTGNTKHYIENTSVVKEIKENAAIIMGYLTSYSNSSFMIKDFTITSRHLWNFKEYCVGQQWVCLAGTGQVVR